MMKNFTACFLICMTLSGVYGQKAQRYPDTESPALRKLYERKNHPFHRFTPENEVLEERSATTKQFFNPETGKKTAVIGAGPVHYFESGAWKTISDEIMPNTSGSHSDFPLYNEWNTFHTYYSDKEAQVLIAFAGGEEAKVHTVGMQWTGSNGNTLQTLPFPSSVASVEEGKIRYAATSGSVDAEVKQLSTGVEMDYLLKDASFVGSAPSDAAFLTVIQQVEIPNGWTMETNREEKGRSVSESIRTLHFYKNGTEVLRFHSPVYYDLFPQSPNGEAQSLKRISGSYETSTSGNLVTVKIKVPVDWLKAPDRSFPVVVDPVINANPSVSTYWTGTVYDNGSTGLEFNDGMRVGENDLTWPTNNKYYQTWAKINLSALPDNICISSAGFYLYQTAHFNGSGCDELRFRIGKANTDPIPDPWSTVHSQINTLTSEYSRWDAYGTGCGAGCQDYYEGANGWKSFPMNSAGLSDILSGLTSNYLTIGIDNLTAYDNHCSGATDDSGWLDWAGYSSTNRPYLTIDYTVNDMCANATLMTGSSQTYSFNTTCAAQDGPTPSCGSGAFREVWYKWVASGSGTLTASTCGLASFDTRIAIFSGSCGAFTEVGCNDDACSSTQSSLTVNVCAGTTYYIAVGGWNGLSGSGSVAISYSGTPALAGGTVGSNASYVNSGNPPAFVSTVAASGGAGTLAYQWQSSPNNSVWTNISGATALTYDAPVLNQTTYYRRKVTDGCNVVAYSNTITISFTYTAPAPVATFTASPTTILVGQTVTFTNTSSNAISYSWNFGDGTTSTATNPTHTYNAIGSMTVTLIAYASPGQSGQSATNTAVITVNPLPVFSLQVDNLIFEANTITGTNPKTLSGNVAVHLSGCGNVLAFGGNVTVNTTTKVMSGNCLVYVPNVQGSNKNIYNGPFSFAISGSSIDLQSNPILNYLLDLAELDLPINDVTLQCNGILIDGNLQLPASLSSFSNGASVSAHLDTVSIHQTTGLWVSGEALLTNLQVYNKLRLDSLYLGFNIMPVERFLGITRLSTPIMSIRGQALVQQRKLKNIDVWVQPYSPVALGTSGISLASAAGYVHNIDVPSTMKIGINGTLVPTFPTDLTAITNAYVSAEYTMGTSFIATGSLNLFNHSLANVGFGIYPYMGEVWGNVNWLTMLQAHARFSVAKYPGQRTQLRGLFGATLSMPNASVIENQTLRTILTTFYSQGQVIATCNNYLTNDYLTGYAALNIWIYHPTASYLLNWGGGLYARVGLNYSVIPQSARQPLGIQKTSGATTPGYYNFNVGYATQNVLIEAKGNGVMPEIEIITALGDTITQTNAVLYDNVHHIKDFPQNFAAFWIQNPRLGDYQVHLITGDSLEIFAENAGPSIRVNGVTQNASSHEVTIQWADNDPDNDAQISLFADTDNQNGDGVIFARNISENSLTDSYTFDYSNFPSGEYYLGALIEDSLGQSAISYFQTPFRLVKNGAPNAPVLISLGVTDSSLTGSYLNNNTAPLTYMAYYSNSPDVNYHSPSVAVSRVSPFEVSDLLPFGRTYYVALSAIDPSGTESDLSNVVSVSYVYSGVNNAPYFHSQNFGVVAKTSQLYSYQLLATDLDGTPLVYTLQSAPLGMNINASGLITWTPNNSQTGYNQVYAKVEDGNGGADSIRFQINVLNPGQDFANIQFDKSTYIETGDGGVITIIHPSFSGDIRTVDVLNFRLYSNSDPVGLLLTATEIMPDANTFTAVFQTGNVTGGNMIEVHLNDTLKVAYLHSLGDSTLQYANVTQFVADFTFVSGGQNDTTTFFNASRGANLVYAWDFGDGNTSSERHPVHVYSLNGTFTITLTITDLEGRISTTTRQIVIDGPLPVDWLNFEGFAESKGNHLKWETAFEVNNDYFGVERSTDGTHFVKIGEVAADNGNAPVHSYQFLDENATVGKSWYRLRQNDVDGAFHYSRTIELSRALPEFAMSIYPNPFQSVLTVNILSPESGTANWTLTDVKGNRVLSGSAALKTGDNQLQITAAHSLSAGTYFLQLQSANGVSITRKVVKE